jgi:hypothetical protein
MVKHLDEEWEIERPRIFHHVEEVYTTFGGWKAVVLFFIGLYAFYSYILYTISTGRKRREAAKMRKKS